MDHSDQISRAFFMSDEFPKIEDARLNLIGILCFPILAACLMVVEWKKTTQALQ